MRLPQLLPLYAVLIPFVAAILIALTGERLRALREFWSFLAAFGLWACIILLFREMVAGRTVGGDILRIAPGLSLGLKSDPFGLTFAMVSSTLWTVTTFYSVGYARALKMAFQTRFFAIFAVCLGSAVGIALASNALTLLLFYEILTVATYPLVVHSGTHEARRAGRLYLCYALTAGALLLGAIAWSYALTGHLEFLPGGFLPKTLPLRTLTLLFILFSLGFAVKAALMPLHAWLPAAMIAPTPVSALLHAVAVVKAGVFGYLRLIYFIFGPELMMRAHLWQPLAWAASVTILVSSLIALKQDSLKKRLAYSTIGHLSYIVLAASLLVPSAQIGALLHLANHAMMKITLFFCAGAIYVATKRTHVSQLNGIGWRMPYTFGAFAVGALGLAGTPFLCGFISKWWIIRGAVETHSIVFAVVLLISGVLNIAYLMPIVVRGFNPLTRVHGYISEAPKTMLIPLLITAAMSVAFGCVFPAINAQVDFAFNAVVQVQGSGP